MSLPSKPYVPYCGQDTCRESIGELIAKINALRNELDAVKAASRHRFTASEVEACMEDQLFDLRTPDFEEIARQLNELMQNEEDYKDAMALIEKVRKP
jgi:hypothetical protein